MQVNPPEPLLVIAPVGSTVNPEVATFAVPIFEVAATVPPDVLAPENVICIYFQFLTKLNGRVILPR